MRTFADTLLAPYMDYVCIAPDVKLGKDVKLAKFINLYGCEIGDETKIGAFVEIQKNARIGRRCKISSHTFICEGVTIEDHVFIGHGVMFINDSYPRATTADGELQTAADWKVEHDVVKKGASIGSGATILSNVTIGERAIVGAGSVVTRDVPPDTIVAGNPARVLRAIGRRNRRSSMSSDSLASTMPTASVNRDRTAVPTRPARRDTVRVGVIGYGYWGPNIVRNLHGLDTLRGRFGVRQEPGGAEARAAQPTPACS